MPLHVCPLSQLRVFLFSCFRLVGCRDALDRKISGGRPDLGTPPVYIIGREQKFFFSFLVAAKHKAIGVLITGMRGGLWLSVNGNLILRFLAIVYCFRARILSSGMPCPEITTHQPPLITLSLFPMHRFHPPELAPTIGHPPGFFSRSIVECWSFPVVTFSIPCGEPSASLLAHQND
jgi:hypothetical protein